MVYRLFTKWVALQWQGTTKAEQRMDSLRNVTDSENGEAPGIEAPPIIGQDERRMHVRAYNFWAKLLNGRSFPSIESLNLDDLGDFGPHTVLLDFTSGIENPAIGYVGDALAHECALPDEIQYIADVPRRSLLSRLTDHYLQIIANRAPIGFEAEFVNERGVTILYRGVLLPFSSDDDTIDFILGVINWKQAAEPALADALNAEMEAAALAAPSHRPTVPVWADGPDADGEHDADHEPVPMPTAGLSSLDDADMGTGETADEPALADFDADTASLADWLAQARAAAADAEQAHVRGHKALYAAIGNAWGFAHAAADAPDDLAELLDEAGIAPSERSPMTPVVKLVFGPSYDKTRLAEFAAVLSHAADNAITPADLPAYLARQDGGLKGLVRHIRAAKRSDAPAPAKSADAVHSKLRQAVALATIDLPWVECDSEFVMLVARRTPSGRHEVVAVVDTADGSQDRTLKAVAKAMPRPRR